MFVIRKNAVCVVLGENTVLLLLLLLFELLSLLRKHDGLEKLGASFDEGQTIGH